MNRIQSLSNVPSAPSVKKPSLPKCTIISLVLTLLFMAGTPIIMQALHYGRSESVLWWLQHFMNAYYLNAAIVCFLFFTVYAISNSAFFAGCSVFTVCMLFSIIDMLKMRILNQPLLPADLFFIRQALDIGIHYALQALFGCMLLGSFIVTMFLLRKRVPHTPLPIAVRITALVILTTGFSLALSHLRPLLRSINHHAGIINEFWNQQSNYQKHGVLYGFVMNLESLSIPKPKRYSRAHIEQMFAPWSANGNEITCTPQRAPDVIVYLSESFWDISAILPVPLPCDPVKNFRKLSKTNPSLKLVSPTFGGNTCNAEFEILTGMSHSFFPPGVMAYNQFIQHPIPSMVSVFKENGYRTTAIHSFKRWFWNRTNVYRHLGFDSFISQETMVTPQRKGTFISDRELSRQIIQQASSDTVPDFIFALSMQNHGPYLKNRYDTLECNVATGLGAKADAEVNTYIQGLIDADRSLAILTDYIDTTSRPTLLLFFGDHLPGFTYIYDETGMTDKIKDDTEWSHTTQALFYANYPLRDLKDTLISMMYVPLAITRQAGVNVPAYYRYLREGCSRLPVLHASTKQRTEQQCTATSALLEDYRIYLYDILFGKQYASRFAHRSDR